jgi:uncharacterized membrane protein
MNAMTRWKQSEAGNMGPFSCRPPVDEANFQMRSTFLKPIQAHSQLFAAVLIGGLLWLLLPHGWRPATRLLTAWDCTTGLFLTLALTMIARSNIDRIRSRAALQEQRWIILVLATITSLVSLAGIVSEMASSKTVGGRNEVERIALAVLTVLLSWTFMHTIFAMHYAHEYYTGPADQLAKGLEFPGDDRPDYWDFMYYSFVIGTACATADVNVTSKVMRRITTLHCIAAFFFNTTILALTVNIGAGLF